MADTISDVTVTVPETSVVTAEESQEVRPEEPEEKSPSPSLEETREETHTDFAELSPLAKHVSEEDRRAEEERHEEPPGLAPDPDSFPGECEPFSATSSASGTATAAAAQAILQGDFQQAETFLALAYGEDLTRFLPLAPELALAIKGEFTGISLNPFQALGAYSRLGFLDFSGADDLRLQYVHRLFLEENQGLRDLLELTLAQRGFGGFVGLENRVKTPTSLFDKLAKTPGELLGEINDLSGIRVNVKPGLGADAIDRVDAAIKEIVGESLGPDSIVKTRNYNEFPTEWGYTGRDHIIVKGKFGNTEIQVGPQEVTDFIQHRFVTSGGDAINNHDVTDYKGKRNGINLPQEIDDEYGRLIARVNRAARSLEPDPALAAEMEAYYRKVEDRLPARVIRTDPELTHWQKIGSVVESRVLGPVAAVGGGLQVFSGSIRLSEDPVDGALKVAEGASNLGVGLGATLRIGTRAVPVLGGASAALDGARDLTSGSYVTGTLKTISAGLVMGGVVIANPAMVAAGGGLYLLTTVGQMAYNWFWR